jgi:mersacidin/lichenicidin family type 2 lantibiotic
MNKIDIVRAWKDEEYRNSLTQEQLASLPTNPAGNAEATSDALSEEELEEVAGGMARPTTWQSCYIKGGVCTHM